MNLPRTPPSPASIGSLKDELWDWHYDWMRVWSDVYQKPKSKIPFLRVRDFRTLTNDLLDTTSTTVCIGRTGLLAPGWEFDGPLTDWNNVLACSGIKRTSGPFAGETACAGGGILFESDPASPDPGTPVSLQDYLDDMKFGEAQETTLGTEDYYTKAIVGLNFKSAIDSKFKSTPAAADSSIEDLHERALALDLENHGKIRTQVMSGLFQRYPILYLFDNGYSLVYLPWLRAPDEPPFTPFSRPGDYRQVGTTEFIVFPVGSPQSQVSPYLEFPSSGDAGAEYLPDFVYQYTVHLRAQYDRIPSENGNLTWYPGTVTYEVTRHHDRQTIAYNQEGEWLEP